MRETYTHTPTPEYPSMYGMQPQQGQQSAHGQATSTPSSHSQTSQPPASAHSDISTGPPAQMSHHQRGAANYPDITRYTPNVIHSPAHMALGNSQQSASSLPGQSPYYANSTTPPSYTSGAQPSTHYPNPADMTASPYSQTPYRPSQDWATSYTHSANMPNAAPYGAQHGSVATPRSHDVHNGNHAHNSNYSFISIPGANQHKRPRRRYEEIERMYRCNWQGTCEKAYGTLNHLNAHVTMQSHGPKRTPDEFKEVRKEWKARKKANEARKKEAEAARASARPQADPQAGDAAGPPTYPHGASGVSMQMPQLPPVGSSIPMHSNSPYVSQYPPPPAHASSSHPVGGIPDYSPGHGYSSYPYHFASQSQTMASDSIVGHEEEQNGASSASGAHGMHHPATQNTGHGPTY